MTRADDKRRTSIYLPEDVRAALKESGEPASAVLRRGLGMEHPDAKLARAAAEAVSDEIRVIVRQEVRAALRELQGGSL